MTRETNELLEALLSELFSSSRTRNRMAEREAERKRERMRRELQDKKRAKASDDKRKRQEAEFGRSALGRKLQKKLGKLRPGQKMVFGQVRDVRGK